MKIRKFNFQKFDFLSNAFFVKFILVVVLFIMLNLTSAQAQELGLDPNGSYDIYIGGGQSLSVIKNVKVVGLRDIKGRTFLVIQTDTFNSITSEGLITFDFIRAIVPSHKTFLQDLSGTN